MGKIGSLPLGFSKFSFTELWCHYSSRHDTQASSSSDSSVTKLFFMCILSPAMAVPQVIYTALEIYSPPNNNSTSINISEIQILPIRHITERSTISLPLPLNLQLLTLTLPHSLHSISSLILPAQHHSQSKYHNNL